MNPFPPIRPSRPNQGAANGWVTLVDQPGRNLPGSSQSLRALRETGKAFAALTKEVLLCGGAQTGIPITHAHPSESGYDDAAGRNFADVPPGAFVHDGNRRLRSPRPRHLLRGPAG